MELREFETLATPTTLLRVLKEHPQTLSKMKCSLQQQEGCGKLQLRRVQYSRGIASFGLEVGSTY